MGICCSLHWNGNEGSVLHNAVRKPKNRRKDFDVHTHVQTEVAQEKIKRDTQTNLRNPAPFGAHLLAMFAKHVLGEFSH